MNAIIGAWVLFVHPHRIVGGSSPNLYIVKVWVLVFRYRMLGQTQICSRTSGVYSPLGYLTKLLRLSWAFAVVLLRRDDLPPAPKPSPTFLEKNKTCIQN